ncbi:ATP-binding cassette domain-containing protein [uncultured Marinobacter sp.]|uniref:ABC transporter ATP-binding protein n=1 Tax=uncultured Marinobacter sp. TaxID=187379 RepID=UPI00263A2E4F|nr:ATP-binding cassette domain-containing protein [uncultured Marinobacter sp.]
MPDLRLEDLSIGSLENVSITVSAGEVVCLSGRSGSGKSRLLRAVADLDAHGGSVWLGNTEQSAVPGHQWRRQVVMVPAESQWWAECVGDHFPVVNSVDGHRSLPVADLGLDEAVMGWSVSRLSSGEKQRLALLRAMAMNPSALLLDEPTANLDADSVALTEHWLKQEINQRQLSVLWVAHDREQIQRVASRHFTIRGHALEAC